MARHNRWGTGIDQSGRCHRISYHPDWLRRVKVTRTLDSGRRSTRILFPNPASSPENSGDRVRTRISVADNGPDLEISLNDPLRSVSRIRVMCVLPGEEGKPEEIEFTIEGQGGMVTDS